MKKVVCLVLLRNLREAGKDFRLWFARRACKYAFDACTKKHRIERGPIVKTQLFLMKAGLISEDNLQLQVCKSIRLCVSKWEHYWSREYCRDMRQQHLTRCTWGWQYPIDISFLDKIKTVK